MSHGISCSTRVVLPESQKPHSASTGVLVEQGGCGFALKVISRSLMGRLEVFRVHVQARAEQLPGSPLMNALSRAG